MAIEAFVAILEKQSLTAGQIRRLTAAMRDAGLVVVEDTPQGG
jgi:hypothetical protein